MNPTITTIDYKNMQKILRSASSENHLFDLAVNTPFSEYAVQTTFLFLGIIVLLMVNKKTGTIDRVALSDTDLAKRTIEVSARPFNEIKIGVNEPRNIIAQAIRTGIVKDTTDWEDLFTPALNAEQARINQSNAGIAYSSVHPINVNDGGALIFSFYQYPENIGPEQLDFMQKYSKYVEQCFNKKRTIHKQAKYAVV